MFTVSVQSPDTWAGAQALAQQLGLPIKHGGQSWAYDELVAGRLPDFAKGWSMPYVLFIHPDTEPGPQQGYWDTAASGGITVVVEKKTTVQEEEQNGTAWQLPDLGEPWIEGFPNIVVLAAAGLGLILLLRR